MSLILEALRKSEAERRRAQVPDLLAEPQAAVAPVPTAPQRWPWLVLGAALLLGTLWLLRGAWSAPSAATPAARPVDAAARSGGAPKVVDGPQTAAPAPAQRPLILTPAPAPARPLEAAVAATPTPAPAIATAPAITTPSSPSVEARAAVAPSDPPAPAVALPPRASDSMARLADIGSEERKQLPPLKLSMHMWNEVPAQRFVIIDGTRLTIGERIGDVAIADIVGDGVVLDWNGRLLKLQLR